MIYVITGKPGHGKTAYGVVQMRKLLLQGETIYANTKLNPRAMFSPKKYKKLFGEEEIEGDIINPKDRETKKILYWQNFSDWQFFKDGTIFCDEGLRYFDSHKWESLSDKMRQRLTEHRKDRLDMYITVQDYTFIDKTIRKIAERFINAELKFGSAEFKKTIMPRISRMSEIDVPTLNRCENLGIDPYNAVEEDIAKYHLENVYQEWFWIKKKIFTWYDTSAKVAESRPENLIHNERSCIECGYTKTSHA